MDTKTTTAMTKPSAGPTALRAGPKAVTADTVRMKTDPQLKITIGAY